MLSVNRSYIRYILGTFLAVIGIVLMSIPFIPFGYLIFGISLLILAPKIRFLKKWIRLLRKRDKKGYLKRIEKQMNDWESGVPNASTNNFNK